MRDISMFPEGYCQTTCRLCPCANPTFKPDSPTVPVPLPPEDVFEEKPLPPKSEYLTKRTIGSEKQSENVQKCCQYSVYSGFKRHGYR